MDRNIDILLGSQKDINSVNRDNYIKLELFDNVSEINEYSVNEAVNSTEVFNEEREANPIYRIYGRIEYLSLLNGLKNNYKVLEDIFTFQNTNSYDILNSFEFYLVKPTTGYTQIFNNGSGTTKYIRYFEVIATPSEFEIFPAGFTNNIYGEQVYAFNFNRDFDISSYYDNFNFPVTELFLYARYVRKTNGNNVAEKLKFTNWNSSGDFTVTEFPLSLPNYNIGDIIQTPTGVKIGDVINYNRNEFTQTQLSGQTFYITTECKNTSNISITLVWNYNPFIPFRLRYFANELNTVNSGSTIYDDVLSIPDYATKIDNDGNYVWRDILPQGYTDPLTGIGVDYPFVNKRRYLFSQIVFPVTPDLRDNTTLNVFNEIWFTRNAVNTKTEPNDDLNNIGKPCQG